MIVGSRVLPHEEEKAVKQRCRSEEETHSSRFFRDRKIRFSGALQSRMKEERGVIWLLVDVW